LTESIKDNVEHIVDEIKEATDKIIEEGVELTRGKKAEPLAVSETVKKRSWRKKRKRLEKLHTARSE